MLDDKIEEAFIVNKYTDKEWVNKKDDWHGTDMNHSTAIVWTSQEKTVRGRGMRGRRIQGGGEEGEGNSVETEYKMIMYSVIWKEQQ